MTQQKEHLSLRSEILDLMAKWRPSTVGELMTMLLEKRGIRVTEATLAKVLQDLGAEGKVKIESIPARRENFSTFIRDLGFTADFWIIVVAVVTLDALIIPVLSNSVSVVLRWILGIPAILLLPGYSIQMALFPRRGDLLLWKRVVLSVGLSIAVTGFYAIILDATSQGIVMLSILAIFSVHTLIIAWVGLLRRYEAQQKQG